MVLHASNQPVVLPDFDSVFSGEITCGLKRVEVIDALTLQLFYRRAVADKK